MSPSRLYLPLVAPAPHPGDSAQVSTLTGPGRIAPNVETEPCITSTAADTVAVRALPSLRGVQAVETTLPTAGLSTAPLTRAECRSAAEVDLWMERADWNDHHDGYEEDE